MSDSKLDRIEAKIDKVSDRLTVMELDLAKQETKIFRRLISGIVLILGLAYSLIKPIVKG
jgi:hypothetical protein